MRLDELWPEELLAKQLGFNVGKTGRSRTLTKLIANGLSYIELLKRRYFVEEDVVNFMLRFKKSSKSYEE